MLEQLVVFKVWLTLLASTFPETTSQYFWDKTFFLNKDFLNNHINILALPHL